MARVGGRIDRVGQTGTCVDEQHAGAHADDGGEQRQACGDEGTESDDEDHGGDSHTDELGRTADLHGLEGVAVVGDVEVAGLVGVDEVGDRGDVLGFDVLQVLCVEGDGERAGTAVVADGGEVGDIGVDRGSDLLVAQTLGLELGGLRLGELLLHARRGGQRIDDGVGVLELVAALQVGDELVEVGLDVRVLEGLSLGGADDDGPGGGFEGVVPAEDLHDLVIGLQRLESRDGHRLGGVLHQAGGCGAGTDEDEDPDGDEPPSVKVCGSSDPVEEFSHAGDSCTAGAMLHIDCMDIRAALYRPSENPGNGRRPVGCPACCT